MGLILLETTIASDLVEDTVLEHTATLEFYPLYHATQ